MTTIHLNEEEVQGLINNFEQRLQEMDSACEALLSQRIRLYIAWQSKSAIGFLSDYEKVVRDTQYFLEELNGLSYTLQRELWQWMDADERFLAAKKRIYLINGINWNSSEHGMRATEDQLEALYGPDVDVVVVENHPFDYFDHSGRREFTPIEWFLGSVRGVDQVWREYVDGWGAETKKVNDWIQADLAKNGLLGQSGIEISLVGHSGGGMIAANLPVKLEGTKGIEVKQVTMLGSPLANRDYASKYAELVVDGRSSDDYLAKIQLRSNEARKVLNKNPIWAAIKDFFTRDESDNIIVSKDVPGKGHDYWGSEDVAEFIHESGKENLK